MSLLIARALDEMTFKGPFQPKLCYDSMIYLLALFPDLGAL